MTLRTYIMQQSASLPLISGDFDPNPGRDAIRVTSPSLVKNAQTSGSKYGLKRDYAGDLYVLDFTFTDLVPDSKYGSGIILKGTGDTFMSGVNVDLGEDKGEWGGYGSTNWDGITVDGPGLFALEDSSVHHFADGGIDSKADTTQINRFVSLWPGHRSLRFWETGPHVIANSIIDNSIGSIIWCKFKGMKIYVFNSLFNGLPVISQNSIETDDDGMPEIIYLETAAEAEALMHPGFGSIGTARPGAVVPPVEPPIDPPGDSDLEAQVAANTSAIAELTLRLVNAESQGAENKAAIEALILRLDAAVAAYTT